MTAKISRYNRLTKEYWCVSLLHDSLYRSQDKGVQVHFAALWILTTCHLKLNKANLRLGEEGMWTIYLVRKVCEPSLATPCYVSLSYQSLITVTRNLN